jgi:putative membrane protein
MKKLTSILTILALSAGIQVASAADQNEKKAGEKMETGELTVQKFVEKAAGAHQFEIEAGQLAVEKAQSEDVRDFGQSMVDAHKELKNDLIELSKEDAVNAKVPTDLGKKHKEALAELRDVDGEQFDQKYLKSQKKAHEKALELFEKADEDGVPGEELQEYAGNSAEAVRDHLDQLNEIMENMKD